MSFAISYGSIMTKTKPITTDEELRQGREKENFIDSTVEIVIEKDGARSRKVIEAKIIGNIAVHMGVTIPDYCLTETSTGLALFKGFNRSRDALYVARYIYEKYGGVPVNSKESVLSKWGQDVIADVSKTFHVDGNYYFNCYRLPKGISSQGRKRVSNNG